MLKIPIDRVKGEKKIFPSPGRCIYCLRDDLPLEDEHIVPFAISGDGMIFKKASCRPCAGIINKEFETHVTGTTFLPFRIRAGAPTRNKRKRPATLELTLVCADAGGKPIGPRYTKQIPAEAFPISLLGWTLPRPGIIAGREPSDEILGEPAVSMFGHEFQPHIDDYLKRTGHRGGVLVSVGRMEREKLFRFIAKTAHAFAAATEGLDSFEPLTLDLIFGRSKAFCHLIGTGSGKSPDPPTLADTFTMYIGSITKDGVEYMAVLVHPFPFFDSPSYIVIVGKCTKHQATLAKDAPDTV